jgi:hypothetical protein
MRRMLPARARPSLGTRSSSFGDCGVTAARVPSECEGDAMFSKNCTCLVMKNSCGFSVAASYKLSTDAKPRTANILGSSSEQRCTTKRATTIDYLKWTRAP